MTNAKIEDICGECILAPTKTLEANLIRYKQLYEAQLASTQQARLDACVLANELFMRSEGQLRNYAKAALLRNFVPGWSPRMSKKKMKKTVSGESPELQSRKKEADRIKLEVEKRVGGKGTEIQCPREGSFMTPCVCRDGSTAMTDDGVCVGCGVTLEEIRDAHPYLLEGFNGDSKA